MDIILNAKNIPDYADDYKYMVLRECDRELWFYGAYDDKATADRARDEVNGYICTREEDRWNLDY